MEFARKINTDALIFAGFAGMFFFLPIGTSPLYICGGIVLALWIMSGRFLKDFRAWVSSGLMVPVLLLFTLPWIGLVYTPLPADGMSIAGKSYYWVFSIASLSVAGDGRKTDFILKMFLAGLSLNSTVAILQYLGAFPLKEGNPVGLFPGSSPWIAFSILLATGTIIASFYFSREQGPGKKLVYLFLVVQYLFTIGFIGGRSGYLAAALLFPVIVSHVLQQRSVIKPLFFAILLLSLVIALPVIKKRVSQGQEDLRLYRQGVVNTSIGLRLHMWEIACSEIRRSPLIGSGTGSFKKAWELRKKDPSLPFIDHPHNSFLYMAVSFGIPGLAALCWLLLELFRRGWKARHTAAGFSVIAFAVVFTVGSLTDTQVLPTPTTMALCLFAGIAGGIDER
ncbi:MAG TPA: O-antigen ligase family protein [Thermodesulfovibrionales bacterium]|nr:O-antigen ligase family protein [Thermodesulfovibrionales bacterium]